MADHEDHWRQFYFVPPNVLKWAHIKRTVCIFAHRAQMRKSRRGSSRWLHSGWWWIPKNYPNVPPHNVLKYAWLCSNVHRYESTSTGVREGCQGGCTLMCSNVLVSKQKSKRGLSGRVHSGWWWIPPPLSLSTVVPAGREWKPPCVLHNANTNTHTGKYRFRKVQKVIQMYTFYLFLGWLYILYRECQTVRLSSILQTQQQHGKKSF